ncbi:MAG: hypothetical protein LBD08_06090 [Treponema sp.]|jgi:hypothetical protein|nr:hypothetical protein [Treponema sp.]
MSFYCLLWGPLIYLLWRSLSPEKTLGAAAGICAVILGSAAALSRYSFGSFFDAEGFAWSRWLGILADWIALPALLPMAAYCLASAPFRRFRPAGLRDFTLLALIPQGAEGVLTWSGRQDPALLVLLPLLWTALASGIPFLLGPIMEKRRRIIAPAVLGILLLPSAAASASWAFFVHYPLAGYLCGGLVCIPMGLAIAFSLAARRTANSSREALIYSSLSKESTD